MQQIKKRCADKFKNTDENNFHSDSIKINFVSATLNQKIESLGSKLMESYVKIGFDASSSEGDEK